MNVLPCSRAWLVAAFTAVAAFCVTSGRASALTELCPATVVAGHAIDDASSGIAAAPSVYAFELGAYGSRTTSGTLTVQTDRGWYTATFEKVALTAHERTFQSASTPFKRTDYYSAPLYIKLQKGEELERVWVAAAHADGDDVFGWPRRGEVSCEPLTWNPQLHGTDSLNDWEVTGRPELLLSPAPGSVTLALNATNAPKGLGCAKPFVEAAALNPVQPEYPMSMRRDSPPDVKVVVTVTIDASGHIIDTWIWGGSPYEAFNQAAFDAARKTTYSPAIALCHPVPGSYLFTSEFSWGP